MCDIFIGEIRERELEVSHLPHGLCTHLLFRIILKNDTVPNSVEYGKEYPFFLFNEI
jgi:hypothetical protein